MQLKSIQNWGRHGTRASVTSMYVVTYSMSITYVHVVLCVRHMCLFVAKQCESENCTRVHVTMNVELVDKSTTVYIHLCTYVNSVRVCAHVCIHMYVHVFDGRCKVT